MDNLKQAVKDLIKSNAESYDSLEAFHDNLQQYGCVSGMISELVYYSDTTAFYETHKEAINELLSETLAAIGVDSPIDVFGDKWDKEDPLCLETTNQNLLAWFAFEEIARQLSDETE